MIELARKADMPHGTYLIHESEAGPTGAAHKTALLLSLKRKTVGQPVKLTNGSEVGQVVEQLTTPAAMQVGKRLVRAGSLLLGIKWADPAMLNVAKEANLAVSPDGVTLYGDDIKKARHTNRDAATGRFATTDAGQKDPLPGIEPAEEDKRPKTPLPAWVQPIRDYVRAKNHHTSRPPFADPVSKELTRGREHVTRFAEKPKQLTQDEVIDQLVAHAERLGIVVNQQLGQLPGR